MRSMLKDRLYAKGDKLTIAADNNEPVRRAAPI